MGRILFAAALLLAAGCTSVAHERVEGWPELRVAEHYVPMHDMLERCRKYVPWGMTPLACAEFNLAFGTCDIWLSESFAPKAVVEHERLHCRGYDHVGETAMRDFLAKYRAWEAAQQSGSAAAGR